MFQVFKSSWLQKRKVKFCLSRPIKNSKHNFSRIFKQDQSLRKRLGFHLNFSTYKRKTLAMFWRCWRRLVCYSLWDLRGFVPSNYTRIYQSQNYNQAFVEHSCYIKINKWRWSEIFEWDLKVTRKAACVAVSPRREGVRGFRTCTWSC